MAVPTFTELEARIAVLEAAKIGLDDLPIADLIRKIELQGIDSTAVLGGTPVGTGGQKIELRFGRSTLTFTASVNSAAKVVTHTLGRDPQVVLVTSFGAPAFGQFPTADVYAHDATTFQMTGELKTAYTGSIPVVWLAIG